jgi:hypothetical protein
MLPTAKNYLFYCNILEAVSLGILIFFSITEGRTYFLRYEDGSNCFYRLKR